MNMENLDSGDEGDPIIGDAKKTKITLFNVYKGSAYKHCIKVSISMCRL
jgi:hypothetical protein